MNEPGRRKLARKWSSLRDHPRAGSNHEEPIRPTINTNYSSRQLRHVPAHLCAGMMQRDDQSHHRRDEKNQADPNQVGRPK
jgi:hypothetical protein